MVLNRYESVEHGKYLKTYKERVSFDTFELLLVQREAWKWSVFASFMDKVLANFVKLKSSINYVDNETT